MSLREIAVTSARYHSRMAVRAVRIFHSQSQAIASRERRDWWMAQARSA